jgi:hypothetical protein
VVSKTRCTIEPKIELGNSFFESKRPNFLVQSYQRDSKHKKRRFPKTRLGQRF